MNKIFVFVSALLVSNAANANLLDFSGNICSGGGVCGNFNPIDQSYGDIASQLNVVYDRNIATPLDAGTAAASLSYWDFYSNLSNLAWGDNGATAEIFLNPLDGSLVTLNSVDFGSYLNLNRTSQFTVLDGLTNAVLFGSTAFNVSTTAVSFNPNVSSLNGLKLQFGPDAFNVGIDNIDYTLSGGGTPSTVPLPAAAWLFGSGIMGLFGLRRKALA